MRYVSCCSVPGLWFNGYMILATSATAAVDGGCCSHVRNWYEGCCGGGILSF